LYFPLFTRNGGFRLRAGASIYWGSGLSLGTKLAMVPPWLPRAATGAPQRCLFSFTAVRILNNKKTTTITTTTTTTATTTTTETTATTQRQRQQQQQQQQQQHQQ
jgi:hypothetical protein